MIPASRWQFGFRRASGVEGFAVDGDRVALAPTHCPLPVEGPSPLSWVSWVAALRRTVRRMRR
jgi:hypothetical protein